MTEIAGGILCNVQVSNSGILSSVLDSHLTVQYSNVNSTNRLIILFIISVIKINFTFSLATSIDV